MMLSDFDILHELSEGSDAALGMARALNPDAQSQPALRIEPFDAKAMLQPASVDFTLGNVFRVFANYEATVIDPEAPQQLTAERVVRDDEEFVLHPGEFVLGMVREKVTIPPHLVARIEGKSSLGRMGLLIHATAGFIDPGFEGCVTLELANVARLPIILRPGMKIAQMSFAYLKTKAMRPYGTPGLGSKYQGDTLPGESQYHLNSREEDGVDPAPPPANLTDEQWSRFDHFRKAILKRHNDEAIELYREIIEREQNSITVQHPVQG